MVVEQVNISDSQRTRINRAMDSRLSGAGIKESFGDAKREILLLMQKDNYTRFKVDMLLLLSMIALVLQWRHQTRSSSAFPSASLSLLTHCFPSLWPVNVQDKPIFQTLLHAVDSAIPSAAPRLCPDLQLVRHFHERLDQKGLRD